MAITQEITRISTAKADIKTAIEAKGVSVPSNALIDTYDDYVAAIPSGGGNKMGEFVDVDPSATYSGDYDVTVFIESVVVPEGITEISNNTFYRFGKLTSVTLPSTLTSIAQAAFANCPSLTSLAIPSGVTSIGSGAFNRCYALTSINIPSGVTSISYQAFYYCTSLATITIPNGVTSIGEFAFQYSGLTSVTIPSSVTSIAQRAFADCSALTTVTCEATTPPTLGVVPFQFSPIAHIYVPASSVETYKAASGWSNYASKIEAIPSN